MDMPQITVTIPQELMNMVNATVDEETSSSPDDVLKIALKQYFDSRSDEKKQLTVKLLSIFTIVNDWLKFAEAKNGILLAFCGAAIPTVMNMLTSLGKTSSWAYIMIIISLFCFFASTLICSWSFLPKTRSRQNLRESQIGESKLNLYFYGDLGTLDKSTLLKRIRKEYFNDHIEVNNLSQDYKEQLDLCDQVTVNASIAMSKFDKFKTALRLLMVGILTFIFSTILKFLPYLNDFFAHCPSITNS
jgi:Arc/MetJ-type ribon-helix-helix transcriptional regulator